MHILTDNLDFFVCLKLARIALRKDITSVRYLRATPLGKHFANLLIKLQRVTFHRAIDVQLHEARYGAKSLIETWLDLRLRISSKLLGNITKNTRFFDIFGQGTKPGRRAAVVQKAILNDINLPLLLGLTATQVRRGDEASEIIVIVGRSGLLKEFGDAWHSKDFELPTIRFIDFSYFRRTRFILICWYLFQISRDCFRRLRRRNSKGLEKTRSSSKIVAIPFSAGISEQHTMLNNDLWWFQKSSLPPNRCLIYFEGYLGKQGSSREQANKELVNSIEKKGYRTRVLKANGISKQYELQQPFPPRDWLQIKNDLKSLVRAVFDKPTTLAPAWRLSLLVRLTEQMRRWQNFILEENIGVLTHLNEHNPDALSMAADLADAARIGFHWSINWTKESLNKVNHQVFFIWGGNFSNSFSTEWQDCPEAILESGCIFLEGDELSGKPGYKGVNRNSFEEKVTRVVCVLDRTLGSYSHYTFSAHHTFFSKILDWAEKSPSVGIVFKFKDKGTPRLYSLAPDIAARVAALEAAKKAVVHDGYTTVSRGTAVSDIVVALGTNSAGIVAALEGHCTFFWEPTRGLEGSQKVWMRDVGFRADRNTFSSMDELIAALESKLVSKTDIECDQVGEGLRSFNNDPYQDGKAAMRIAWFVQEFCVALDQGVERDQAINEVTARYQEHWHPKHRLKADAEA